jgi:tetratricopeptide (TPR) repeat protein
MSNHEFWNELGNLYFMNGAYDPAIHAYVRSIQMDDKFGRPYSNLAMAFVQTGKYAEAIKLYRRSIELLPSAKERAITWNRLGILYRHIKDYRSALDAYQQADILDLQQNEAEEGVSLESKLPLSVSMPCFDFNSILEEDNLTGEINAKLKVSETQGEIPWFDGRFVLLDPEKISQELEVDPQEIEIPVNEQSEWKLAYTEGAAIPKVSEVAEGEQNLQNEVLIHNFLPDGIAETETQSEQSKLVVDNSQTMESVKSRFENIIEFEVIQSSHPLPELSPAELSSIELDIAKYKAETINNPRNVSAWETLGDAYKSAGKYKDAIQAYKTAININSTKPAYYYRLGLMYAAERSEAEAVLAFEKVLELDPNHALAHASLGSHYLKKGMDELAQTHIKQALNTNFEEENEYNRACLEAICGNTDRALELLQIALQTKQTYINWAKNDPDLDSLHDDYRFKTLLSAYGTS